MSVIAKSSTELVLKFNEKLKAEIPVLTNFLITPNTEIIAINFEEAALTKLVLKLNTALISETDYTLTVVGIRDCNGNMMEAESFIFGLPEGATAMDIVINEILFNPRPTGVDFVELYNPTTKYFNLKNWSLANRAGDLVANAKTITKDDLILAPKEYRVITSDAETILSHYPLAIERNIFQSQLPSLPDDEGSIVLVNNDQHVIDEFQYSDDLHSVFIKDDDGVSLERIAANRPTMDGANWKSASATVGFATPGYLNSNSLAGPTTSQDDVTVQPELFIPIYGQPDFTEIRYKFDQGGWVANIKIFSTRGVLIKVVANNITLGTEGFFRWDGDQEDGSKARIGYYLVWFQVFDSGGQVKTFRKRVVIGTEF